MKVIGAVILAGLAIVATSFMPTASCADSWATPTTETFTSCKGHARVVVTPRDLENQLAYFEDKVDGVEPAGQKGTGPNSCEGARRDVGGRDVARGVGRADRQ